LTSLESCFFFDAVEDSYEITGIEGRMPDWVRGSYYVNGPARFERDGRRYKHWLDGDGMVCALHFTDTGVRFVSKFVRTRKLTDEDQAGAFLYRGFGTAFEGDRLRRSSDSSSPISYRCRAGRFFAYEMPKFSRCPERGSILACAAKGVTSFSAPPKSTSPMVSSVCG